MLNQKSEKMTFTIEYSPRTRGSSHRAEVRHEIHHIPRERGGLPVVVARRPVSFAYSPRTRGSTYGGVSGCRYANIPLRKQGCHSLRR